MIAAVVEGITSGFVFPMVEFLWRQLQPHYGISKKVVIGILLGLNVVGISVCLSAFTFGTFYFYHMPTVFHSFPLYFQYNRYFIDNVIVQFAYFWLIFIRKCL